MSYKWWITGCIAIVVLAACKHDIINPDGTANGGGNGGSNTVCFEAEVLPIFRSSCAKSGCHDAGSRQDGYQLDTYVNIVARGIRAGNANDSKIFQAITDSDPRDRMPLAPNPALTAAQIDVIRRWINEGARNTTNCGTVCDTTSFTFSGAVNTILTNNCVGCHNNTTAPSSGGVNLSSYAGVRTVALNGKLLGAVEHRSGFSPMPKGGNKLSDCNIVQIRKWINAGALNN